VKVFLGGGWYESVLQVQRIYHNFFMLMMILKKKLMSIIQKLEEMASVLDIPKDPIGDKHSMAQLVQTLRYKSLIRFPTVSIEFFIDIILPAALWH